MMSGPSDDDHGEKRTQAKSAQMASISPVLVQDLSMLVRPLCISLASGLPQFRIHIRRGGEMADDFVGVNEFGDRFLTLGSKSQLFVL